MWGILFFIFASCHPLIENNIYLNIMSVIISAVVGMFFPYRHVAIIWSRRRHACRHNSSFKIEWNTRRKTVKTKVSRVTHAYIISLPSYLFIKALNLLMWRFGPNDAASCVIIYILFFHCSFVDMLNIISTCRDILCVDINVDKRCVDHSTSYYTYKNV